MTSSIGLLIPTLLPEAHSAALYCFSYSYDVTRQEEFFSSISCGTWSWLNGILSWCTWLGFISLSCFFLPLTAGHNHCLPFLCFWQGVLSCKSRLALNYQKVEIDLLVLCLWITSVYHAWHSFTASNCMFWQCMEI